MNPPIELQALDTPGTAASKVNLKSNSIIILLGNFDAALQPKVRSILSRAVAPLALDSGALIVDNGATSGSAAAMGLAARDQETPPALLAIVANNAKDFDPDHPLILRLPAGWPDTIKSTFQIAGQLAKGPARNLAPEGDTGTRPHGRIGRVRRFISWCIESLSPKPDAPPVDATKEPEVKQPDVEDKSVLAVLFGGSDDDLPSLIQCARRQWPILLMTGSGGLADRIVEAAKPPEGAGPKPIDDPALAEIVETASLTQFPIDSPVDGLERILVAHLEMRIHTLADAWSRYDDLDGAAVRKQRSFKRMQAALLILGVAATLLAIVQSNSALPPWLVGLFPWFKAHLPSLVAWFNRAVRPHREAWALSAHLVMIVTPIVISILVSTNSRFREGNKWILLRSAAESIKREIFRYRARAGFYSNQQSGEISREARLSAKIKDITSALIQSEVNKTNLEHIPKDKPELLKLLSPEESAKVLLELQNRLNFLKPEEYATDRLQDQIGFMVGKTGKLNRQLKRNQLCIYVAGGLGTLLAAINSDVWVALTTSLATALTTKLESEQVENSLVQYNQALTALLNIKTWWNALSQWEKGRRKNIDLLVEQTEQTMEFELSGWVQQMQSALDKLTEKESGSADRGKPAGGG